MALVYADRVKETSTTTGTGTYTLAGAVTGFQSFGDGVGNANTCYYCAENGTDWEVGLGTYTAAGTTLARTTIVQSSNADAAVSWAAGTKNVFVTVPASQVYADPLTTRGDILTRGASATQRVALGATNTVVGSDGTDTVFRTLTAVIDAAFGSTRGQVLRRGASAWEVLAAATTNQVLAGDGTDVASRTVTALLDAVIGSTRGMLAVRGAAVWQSLAVGGAGLVLGSDGTDPGWITPWASVNNGRLTLTSGTSVTTADVTGATSVYFTPHNGDQIGLYDGTRWKVHTFTELTLALGTITSGLPYDVFIYDNAGTLTLELLAWTNGTTRATALVRQNGVWSKTGALTRRYLGTFYTTSTTTTEDSAAKRFLWNADNRVQRPAVNARETTNTWTYTTATWRQANANTANQIAYVCGIAGDGLIVEAIALGFSNAAAGFSYIGCGLGIDSTSVNSGRPCTSHNLTAAGGAPTQQISSYHYGSMLLGYHYVAWLEYTLQDGGSVTTWTGDNGGDGTIIQSGMVGMVWS